MKFKKNEGTIDRIFRVVVGLALIVLGFQYAMVWLWVVGLIVLGTGLVGWCGIYQVLGISTYTVKPATDVKDQTPPTSTPPVM